MFEFSELEICKQLDIPQDFFNLIKEQSPDTGYVEIKNVKYHKPAVLYIYHRITHSYSMLRLGEYDYLKSLADITSQRLIDMNDIIASDLSSSMFVSALPRNSTLITRIVDDSDYLGVYLRTIKSISDLALSILNHPVKSNSNELSQTA